MRHFIRRLTGKLCVELCYVMKSVVVSYRRQKKRTRFSNMAANGSVND